MNNLLHNKHYFDRYGEHVSDLGDCREAWEATERDLFRQTGGFRRFISYNSFAVALSKWRSGEKCLVIRLKLAKMPVYLD